MPDETQTQAHEPTPDRTVAVSNLHQVVVTSPGEPTQSTLARSLRPTVSGYELIEVVGRGGMGVVYRARQLTLERDIALKFLRDEFHPQSATGLRFLEEARITGQLQHPGIPAVHEVGVLPDGRPYLAMKLIKGRTLDALLKEQGPGSTKWLAAFEAICQAVGFAHAHSVIHRDLKPSNVMVGAFAEVQVMDWGLAKVLGRTNEPAALPETLTSEEKEAVLSLRDTASIQTRAGSYLGTPAFMAPEQATGAVDQLSARTDVFGLGGILCTLLTGLPPYLGSNSETTRLLAAASRLDDALARLEKCGAEPELVALCKRCLAANPDDRPADGAAVARDVATLRAAAEDRARQAEVDLARTEVQAAADAKRRRARFAAASAIAAVLLLGLVSTGYGWFKADKAQKLAETNEKNAEHRRLVMESVTQFFLNDLFRQADATAQANARLKSGANYEAVENPTMREVLDRAATELKPDKIEAKFPNQPEAQGVILRAVGDTYRGLGEFSKAITFLTQATEVFQSHEGAEHKDTLVTQNRLSLAYLDAGRAAQALDLFEKVHDTNLRIKGSEDESTIRSTNNLALAYVAAGKIPEALKLLETADEALKSTKGPDDPITLFVEYNLAVTYHKKAFINESGTGKQDEVNLRKAIEGLEKVNEARSRVLSFDHPDTLQSLDSLALAYINNRQIDKGIKLYEQILAARVKANGEFHPQTLTARNNLALAYKEAGLKSPDKLKEAIERFEKLSQDCASKLEPDAPLSLEVLNNLAECYIISFLFKDEGNGVRLDKAIELLVKVRDERIRKLTEDHPDTIRTINALGDAYWWNKQYDKCAEQWERVLKLATRNTGPFRPDPIVSMHNLATVMKKNGNKKRAVELHLEVAKYLEKNGFQHHDCLLLMIGLCNDFEELGMFAEAEPWRRRVVAFLEQQEGEAVESKPYTRELVFLGRNLLKLKKWPDASKVLSKAYTIRKKNEGGTPQFFNVQSMYGEALLGEKKIEDAKPLLVEGYEGLKAIAEARPNAINKDSQFIIKEAGERLLKYYIETKQDAKAVELRKELKKDNVGT